MMIIFSLTLIGTFFPASVRGDDLLALEGRFEIKLPSGPTSTKLFSFNIFEKVEGARLALANASAGYEWCEEAHRTVTGSGKKKQVKTIIERNLCEVNTVLAAVHRVSGELRLIRVSENGRSPSDTSVEIGSKRGVNTTFRLLEPLDYVVLAIKRAVHTPTASAAEVVYTPYSIEIDTPETRLAGASYLAGIIERGRQQLIKNRVTIAGGNNLITESIAPETVYTLAIVEHIDPGRFARGDDLISLINETLVTLGLNRELSYRYSVSSAKARGLFQFIPTTYAYIKQKCPRAGLMRDFVEGMETHENAAKAAHCLLDADLARIPDALLKKYGANVYDRTRVLAAAYNGGATRTIRALKKYGHGWVAHLPKETRLYVAKTEAVWKVLFPDLVPIVVARSK